MPRYVILRHELPAESARASHWDFMLEANGVLRTWAFEEDPRCAASGFAQQLVDHRLDYLTYEGPVSNNRGQVTRVAAGEFQILHESARRIELLLPESQSSSMRLVLERIAGVADEDQRWCFTRSK